MNDLRGPSSGTRSGNVREAGTTISPATKVTVNGANAALYADQTFAKANIAVLDGTNTFTAVATDALGRWDTNTSISYLPASISFAYDLNGNLRTNGTRLLDYDDENQLVRVTEPGARKSEFTYDGKMRRRIRKEYTWASGIWNLASEIRYVYDGNLVLQERNAFNLPQVTYTRGRDLSGSLEGAGGIGGLLARTENFNLNTENSLSAHAYYNADGNGNVTCLIATNQTIVARYLYDPFGNLLAATGPLADANLYRFSSKEWHPASGLVYYLYRHYDSALQRWINRDPAGARRKTDNLYETLGNAPVLYVDPDGRETFSIGGFTASIAKPLGGLFGGIFGKPKDPWLSLMLARCAAPHGLAASLQFCDDKMRHCYTSCLIARDCGMPISGLMGIIKEMGDLVFHEGFDPADMKANIDGLACAGIKGLLSNFTNPFAPVNCLWSHRSCMDCCFRKGYSP